MTVNSNSMKLCLNKDQMDNINQTGVFVSLVDTLVPDDMNGTAYMFDRFCTITGTTFTHLSVYPRLFLCYTYQWNHENVSSLNAKFS